MGKRIEKHPIAKNDPGNELKKVKKMKLGPYNMTDEKECIHEWNEVKVWTLGVTYIRHCLKCNLKETITKTG